MKIGTIGVDGELLKVLVESDLEVVAVANTEAAGLLGAGRSKHPGSVAGLQLVRNPIVDAIILSVDSSDRFLLAHEALKAGKHVLSDARLANTLAEALFLASFARSQERVLLSCPPALHSEAVRRARSLLAQCDGRMRYLTSRRGRFGSRTPTVDESWDRVACDLALFGLLTESRPTWVSAVASSQATGADFGSLCVTLGYETPRGSLLARIELDEDDDREHDSISATVDGLRLDLVRGGPHQIDLLVNGELQKLAATDPRIDTFRYFATCIDANRELERPGLGLDVAHTLDAAQRSLQSSGRSIAI